MNTRSILGSRKGIKTLSFEKTAWYDIHFFTYSVIKRVFDILFSLIGIILTLPLMIILGIIIKIDSPGPAFFKQERTGLHGKTFKLIKFRSMPVHNDVHDFSKADEHTKVGTFIRKTSLDEIPQLFNILLGQMTFIGPRPWITDYYDNMNKKERVRCDVLPGITGLAQAKGRNNISIFEKINYDIEYIRDFGFLEDIKVVFLTIKTVLSKEGADAGKNTIRDEINDLRIENTQYNLKPIKSTLI